MIIIAPPSGGAGFIYGNILVIKHLIGYIGSYVPTSALLIISVKRTEVNEQLLSIILTEDLVVQKMLYKLLLTWLTQCKPVERKYLHQASVDVLIAAEWVHGNDPLYTDHVFGVFQPPERQQI